MNSMRKLRIITGIVVLLSIVSIRSLMGAGIQFENLNLSKAKDKANKENKLVFVDVYASWCGPCKYLSKITFVDQEVGEVFDEHFISIKIDGEKGEGPQLMEEFGLDAFPTLLFLSPEGELVKRKVGALDAAELIQIANDVLHPEKSQLFLKKAEYDSGNRGKEFLWEYFELLLADDQSDIKNAKAILDEIVERYPNLNLEDELDFSIFVFGVHDVESPLMKEYVDNIMKYEELHGPGYATKFEYVIQCQIDIAVEKGDASGLLIAYDYLFPALKTAGYDFDYGEMKEVILKEFNARTN